MKSNIGKIAALSLLLFLLVACSDNNKEAMTISEKPAQYNVTIINGSAKQLLSPGALLVNDSPISLWAIGEAASVQLETLAESGSPAALREATPVTLSSTVDATPAGVNNTVSIEIMGSGNVYLSYVSMPVYTNDGFVGIQNLAISDLEAGDSMTVELAIYDAGTEANDEALSSIPGPTIGGEGFSAVRDDIHNFVTMHPGIVSSDDGLIGSVLDEGYRFDKGTFQLRVSRIH